MVNVESITIYKTLEANPHLHEDWMEMFISPMSLVSNTTLYGYITSDVEIEDEKKKTLPALSRSRRRPSIGEKIRVKEEI